MGNNHLENTQPIAELRKNLGKSVKAFPIRNRNVKRLLALIGGILLILSSIVIAVFLSIRAWQAFNSHGWAIILSTTSFILLLLLIILPLGILLIFWAKRHWKDGINVYEQGFSQKLNKNTEAWFWTEVDQLDTRIIRSVFGGSEVNSRVEISIQAQNHPALKISHNYENMAELTQMIRNNTLPVLFQKLLPLLAAKEQTIFHKNLELDFGGITFNQNQLNWHDIDSVETQRGNLTFKAKNKNEVPIKIPLHQIKNLDLLLFIIHNPDLRKNLPTK